MATEEQTEQNTPLKLYRGGNIRTGQQLTISNRTVTKLGFWLCRVSSPTGDVTFTIRKVSDDSIIASKLWGNAADLAVSFLYKEVTFDTPPTIDEEVYILVEFSGGNVNKYVCVAYQNSDVKANEFMTRYYAGAWTDFTAWDITYIYTYSEVAAYYHGLKVQGEGELALCDVGSNPLRMRKGGTTYGVELVATDDPNASRVRIKTGAGIKAIRKYT